ncbi:hypothetical protein HETIRDRAFT_62543 [Heterobasidion irregulare TC 32-1]|uniref:CID domain-containing protein n=1 Tax=Heterobasidion irregulare (strain TC 32-1) TaxID=747525 RepID=W4KFR8_HETIT|nr:uncharacterized protein HETIRDRAFT_62543 [Heterobasidion irregulare TC 32-1]ETW83891.1 hypothetical protein HETIRDRAFT_62543 [Heterobasidion irregulare TC 32-1]
MSTFPPNVAYSQIPPATYPFQPHPSYQYPPPSSSLYMVDPNTFRRDYTMRLAELTVNSRPIIQNLSMVAQEYSRWADVVVQCIENHIRQVPPWMKLPSFYLLDAVSKNVYDPYARHFASVVTSLFLDSYGLVEPGVRSKMEEMLLTWRTGGPHGRELFGVGPQVAIERGIWGSGVINDSSLPSGAGTISKSQVISELEFTLGQTERALQSNPFDSVIQNDVSVLHQLRKLVEDGGVSQEELRQILTKLRSLARPPPPNQPAPSIGPSKYSSNLSASYTGLSSYPPPVAQPPPPLPPAVQQFYSQPPSNPYPSFDQIEAPLSALPSTAGPSSTTTSSTVTMPNISNLFEALLKAGVVSATGTPTGAGTTTTASEVEESKPAPPEDLDRDEARAYREAILAENIKFTSADISRRRSRIVHFLYDRLPVQCKQCAIRFQDTVTGRKQMQDHLDMHFRQNRKANQNVGRGHSRSWFVGAEDWVHDTSASSKGKGNADQSRPLNAKAVAAAEAAKRDAELRAQFVVVPPGDEAKHIACPICKEVLKSEFQEEDEEWVWLNAVKVEDRIYHATCHAEARTSATTIAARLRMDAAVVRSRSATPDVSSQRGTPPRTTSVKTESSPLRLAGTKRKVESEDVPGLGSEAEGSPPMKKTLLSTA